MWSNLATLLNEIFEKIYPSVKRARCTVIAEYICYIKSIYTHTMTKYAFAVTEMLSHIRLLNNTWPKKTNIKLFFLRTKSKLCFIAYISHLTNERDIANPRCFSYKPTSFERRTFHSLNCNNLRNHMTSYKEGGRQTESEGGMDSRRYVGI